MLWRRRYVLLTKSCNVFLLLLLNLIFASAACVKPDSCGLYRLCSIASSLVVRSSLQLALGLKLLLVFALSM